MVACDCDDDDDVEPTPDGGIVCGAGTIMRDGGCEAIDPEIVCGAGTVLVDGRCEADADDPVRDGGIECGTGTIERGGRCVAIDAGGFECGPGTVAVDGLCEPIDGGASGDAGMGCGPGESCDGAVVCGDGTIEVDGVCEPIDAGMPCEGENSALDCDALLEHSSATLQDFSGPGGACSPQTGTRYACDAVGDAPYAVGPVLLSGQAPEPERFLRLAIAPPPGFPEHNRVAFERTAGGPHDVVIADFDFRITPRRGSRADGFGFALLNTAYHPEGDVTEGDPAEEPSFRGSLGIGFDIYQNDFFDDLGDPNQRFAFSNSISIHFGDGDDAMNPDPLFVQAEQFDFSEHGDLASGLWHHARVSLRANGADSLVSVWITPPCGSPVEVASNVGLTGVQPYESRAWFGARSGGDAAEHDIANVRVQFMDAGASGVAFAAREVIAAEDGGEVELTLVRTGDLRAAAEVGYATASISATADEDFESRCGRVTFAAEQAERTIRIRVLDDDRDETRLDAMNGLADLVPTAVSESFRVSLTAIGATTRVLGPAVVTVAIEDDESARRFGAWGPLHCSGIVGVHAQLLPSGKILYQDRIGGIALWNEQLGVSALSGPGYNLFCNGAALLGDGRVLLAGGHADPDGATTHDGHGVDNLTAFDPVTEAWQALAPMNGGRWYPTVTTLSDGSALLMSGQMADDNMVPVENELPQVYLPVPAPGAGSYRDLTGAQADTVANDSVHDNVLYPWMFALPEGRAIKAGPAKATWILDTDGAGSWQQGPAAQFEPTRTYGSAVFLGTLEDKRVLVTGGGDPPTRSVEQLEVSALPAGAWQQAPSMIARRRQHNATVLPDGRVLVTGGCSGGGFSDVDTAVTAGEIYALDRWSALPAASVRRCYHSFALLMPDGSVLTGGGGQGAGVPSSQNTFQHYYPDYFFKDRPAITAAPAEVAYDEPFVIETAASIERITLVRLGSPTHSFDQNQRYLELPVTPSSGEVGTEIASDGWTPPGDYLLFVLDAAGVPSEGHWLRVGP